MFHGSIVALLTPMDESGKLELDRLPRFIDHLIADGSSGLVIAGTTGESATLDHAEFEALLEAAIDCADNRIPVLAGTGSPSTDAAIKRTRLAQSLGANGALVVTPYYNRPMASGLEAHYAAIANHCDLPLVLYNVPSRTGVDLKPGSVARLARMDSIVAVKEAVSDPIRIHQLLSECGDDISILSGDDESCTSAMLAGAKGVISVAANAAPAMFADLCRMACNQETKRALALEAKIKPLLQQLSVETNPIPVKWAVYEQGLIGPGIRLPLLPLEEQYRPGLVQCLNGLELLGSRNR